MRCRIPAINPQSSGRRVLVVDDDEGVRGLLRAIFQRAGHRADFAADGVEALRKIEEAPYDVVILDLMMPGGSGFELLARLEKASPPKRCVIVVSAAAVKIIQGLESAAIHSKMRKPFDLDALLAQIEDCMGRTTVSDEISESSTTESAPHRDCV
jgi:DNA-binding response OmpR family regulator